MTRDGELAEIRDLAVPLAAIERLLDAVGDARYVLLGEASHGTSDYYRCRAAITNTGSPSKSGAEKRRTRGPSDAFAHLPH